MIVRRRNWTHIALGMKAAKPLVFGRPVTKREVHDYIVNQLKKIPQKIWPV